MLKSVSWHLAVWSLLLIFWLAAAVFSEHANGPMFSNKYLYSMEPSTNLKPDDDATGVSAILDDRQLFSDTKPWPSGRRMNMFKNELGCSGNFDAAVHAQLADGDNLHMGRLNASSLLNLQYTYNPSPNSVCSCIDKLYYASFWKDGTLPASIQDKLASFFKSEAGTAEAQNITADQLTNIKNWMLGYGAYGGQAKMFDTTPRQYDGLGFVSFMQTALSTDTDAGGRVFTCTEDKLKTDTVAMDTTQCVMRRDAAILSVCTRSAQGVQVVEYRGIFNASRIKNYGVMSLFLYMFLTLFRHMQYKLHTNEKDPNTWTSNWVRALAVLLPLYVILMLYFALHVLISMHGFDLSRSDPYRAGVLTALVVTVTLVGMLDAVYAVVGVCMNAWHYTAQNRAHPETTQAGPPQKPRTSTPPKFLPLHPTSTVELVRTRVCIDIQYIAGFTHLLLALVLEASVSEVRSLVVVVLMVLVAAFTQHLANVVLGLQDMVLAREGSKSPVENDEQRVSASAFRFLNEGDACRLYLGLAFIFTTVYLIVSPRESSADPAMSVFVIAVFFFGAVSTGFDVIREVETKMTRTMWISRHDVDNVRSYVLFFLVFMLTVQSTTARYKYYTM